MKRVAVQAEESKRPATAEKPEPPAATHGQGALQYLCAAAAYADRACKICTATSARSERAAKALLLAVARLLAPQDPAALLTKAAASARRAAPAKDKTDPVPVRADQTRQVGEAWMKRIAGAFREAPPEQAP